MRRLFAIFALLLPVFQLAAQYKTADYRRLDDSETVASFREHVSFLSSYSMEGRAAGSEGEAEAAAYVTDRLRQYGIDILSGEDGDAFGIMRENGDTLTSRNVIGYIPGYDKKLNGHYIVIGARLDNLPPNTMTVDGRTVQQVFNGANGNASGLAMLIELGRMLSTTSLLLRRSVLLVGFGASAKTMAGSWYFLNRAFPDVDGIDAMINLDMLGTLLSGGFYAYTSSNQDMNSIVQRLSASLQPVLPELVSSEPYPSDHRAFYDKRIPSIMFTTGKYPEYATTRDTEEIIDFPGMEKELEYIYNFTLELANGEKPDFDREEKLKKYELDNADTVIPFNDCDWKPSFLGSNDPAVFLQKWVYQYLRYPQQAVSEGIQGRVLVDFVIDEKGKVSDVKVLKGVDPLLDAEAVRVISASPSWKPGIVRGKKVKTGLSLYVEFRLEKKKK